MTSSLHSRVLLSAGASLLALFAGSAVHAQTTEPAAPVEAGTTDDAAAQDTASDQEIVVTGFRSSLDKALSVKRNEAARSTRSWRRTSPISPTSTSPNRSSAFPA
jgi:iron complex outermembrane receptor protein